jgi:transcriptional regulator with XRE-family HTH domain
MILGERIKARMSALGISQGELARRVGIKQPSIHALVSGENKRGSAHLHRIARELGTTPAYLSGETDDATEGALPAPKAQDIAEQLDAVLIPRSDRPQHGRRIGARGLASGADGADEPSLAARPHRELGRASDGRARRRRFR